jgi:O-antigen ligase
LQLLFAAVFGFAFVSSEAAALWDLERWRMSGFLAASASLLAVAIARAPYLESDEPGTPALLALLLATILAADVVQGEVDPIDYKVASILLLVLVGPNLARASKAYDPAELVWRLLTLYVVGTALLAVLFVPEFLLRGRPDLVRVDFTGSLVAHAGLCVVYFLATLASLEAEPRAIPGVVRAALAACAAVMVLLTGTRTALVTCGIYLVLDIASAPNPADRLSRLGPVLAGALVLLATYTVLVSDDFVERLLPGGSQDWSSGRLVSQIHWLTLALEQPLGLGFGAVRELLRDGRPALDGASLLEWPHNEPLRFFVEGGLPGLLFIVLLLSRLVRLALRSARLESRPLPRALVLAIAADMLAQSLFQNYFNNVYYATGLLLVLVTLAASVEHGRELVPPGREKPERDDLPSAAATT